MFVVAGALVVVGIVFVDAVSLMIACDVDIGVVACDTVAAIAAVVVNLVIMDALVVADSIIAVVMTVLRGNFHVVSRVIDVDVLLGVARASEDATVFSERGFVVAFTVDLVDLFVVRVTVGN